MMNPDSNIDHLFRDGLAEMEVTPPVEVWEEVHNSIQTKRRILPLFYRVAAASVLLFMLAGSAWVFIFNQPDRKEIAEVNSSVTDEIITPPTNVNDNLEEEESIIPVTEDLPVKALQTDIEPVQLATLTEEEVTIVENQISMAENKEENIVDPVTNGLAEPEEAPRTIVTRNYVNLETYQPIDLLTLSTNNLSRDQIPLFPIETIPLSIVENSPRWIVGGQFSPVYSFRYIGQNSLESYNRDSYNSQENGMVTYTGGIHIQYIRNPKLSILAGIYYSRMGQQIDGIQLYKSANNEPINLPIKGNLDINNSFGSINSENKQLFFQDEAGDRVEPLFLSESYDPLKEGLIPVDATIVQSLEYLEVPLILRYKLVDRKVGFNILGGLSTNFMIGNKAYANQDGSKIKIGETNGLRTINYSTTLGVGLEYDLTDRVILNLEPSFKFYLNSINLDDRLNTHPYTIGIFTGVSYIFK